MEDAPRGVEGGEKVRQQLVLEEAAHAALPPRQAAAMARLLGGWFSCGGGADADAGAAVGGGAAGAQAGALGGGGAAGKTLPLSGSQALLLKALSRGDAEAARAEIDGLAERAARRAAQEAERERARMERKRQPPWWAFWRKRKPPLPTQVHINAIAEGAADGGAGAGDAGDGIQRHSAARGRGLIFGPERVVADARSGDTWLHLVAKGRGDPVKRAEVICALLEGSLHERVLRMDADLVNYHLRTFVHDACRVVDGGVLLEHVLAWAETDCAQRALVAGGVSSASAAASGSGASSAGANGSGAGDLRYPSSHVASQDPYAGPAKRLSEKPGSTGVDGCAALLPLLAPDIDGVAPLQMALVSGNLTAAVALARHGGLRGDKRYIAALTGLEEAIMHAKEPPPPEPALLRQLPNSPLTSGLRSLSKAFTKAVDRAAAFTTDLQIKQAATGREVGATEVIDLPTAAAVTALQRRKMRQTEAADQAPAGTSSGQSHATGEGRGQGGDDEAFLSRSDANAQSRATEDEASDSAALEAPVDGTSEAETGIAMEDARDEQEEGVLCCVCYCEVDAEAPKLPCEHATCSDCWRMHLKARIEEGDVDREGLRCPGVQCPYRIPECKVAALMVGQEVHERYEKVLAEKFVQIDDKVRWCPLPECKCAVALAEEAGRDFVADAAKSRRGVAVRCAQGHAFCWSCGREPHEPASCAQMREWAALTERSARDSELANAAWLESNTEPCPRCNTPVEKNDGCNHMTCRCGHHYCWACRRPWMEHSRATGGSYYCRLAPPSRGPTGPATRAAQAPKRGSEAERLRVHVTKARAYDDEPEALRAAVARVRAVLQVQERPTNVPCARAADAAAMATARRVARQLDASLADIEVARRYLKHAHIFGYFLPFFSVGRKHFEALQRDLETMTEALSSVLLPAAMSRAVDAAQAARQQRVAGGPPLAGAFASLLAALAGGTHGRGTEAAARAAREIDEASFYHAQALCARVSALDGAAQGLRATIARLQVAVRSGVVKPS